MRIYTHTNIIHYILLEATFEDFWNNFGYIPQYPELDVVKVGSVKYLISVVRVSENFENLFPDIIIFPPTFFLVNLVNKMI